MSEQEIRDTVMATLRRVAPEVDPTKLRPDVSIREQSDLDSVDYLRFIVTLHERLGVDIPEADYARVTTLNDCVRYLIARLGAAAADR